MGDVEMENLDAGTGADRSENSVNGRRRWRAARFDLQNSALRCTRAAPSFAPLALCVGACLKITRGKLASRFVNILSSVSSAPSFKATSASSDFSAVNLWAEMHDGGAAPASPPTRRSSPGSVAAAAAPTATCRTLPEKETIETDLLGHYQDVMYGNIETCIFWDMFLKSGFLDGVVSTHHFHIRPAEAFMGLGQKKVGSLFDAQFFLKPGVELIFVSFGLGMHGDLRGPLRSAFEMGLAKGFDFLAGAGLFLEEHPTPLPTLMTLSDCGFFDWTGLMNRGVALGLDVFFNFFTANFFGLDDRAMVKHPKPVTEVVSHHEDSNAGLEGSGSGDQVFLPLSEQAAGAWSSRRSSPRLSNASSGTITQKAITRKIVLREGTKSGGLEDCCNYGRKKITKKSRKCGVLLGDSDALAFEAFLQGRA